MSYEIKASYAPLLLPLFFNNEREDILGEISFFFWTFYQYVPVGPVVNIGEGPFRNQQKKYGILDIIKPDDHQFIQRIQFLSNTKDRYFRESIERLAEIFGIKLPKSAIATDEHQRSNAQEVLNIGEKSELGRAMNLAESPEDYLEGLFNDQRKDIVFLGDDIYGKEALDQISVFLKGVIQKSGVTHIAVPVPIEQKDIFEKYLQGKIPAKEWTYNKEYRKIFGPLLGIVKFIYFGFEQENGKEGDLALQQRAQPILDVLQSKGRILVYGDAMSMTKEHTITPKGYNRLLRLNLSVAAEVKDNINPHKMASVWMLSRDTVRDIGPQDLEDVLENVSKPFGIDIAGTPLAKIRKFGILESLGTIFDGFMIWDGKEGFNRDQRKKVDAPTGGEKIKTGPVLVSAAMKTAQPMDITSSIISWRPNYHYSYYPSFIKRNIQQKIFGSIVPEKMPIVQISQQGLVLPEKLQARWSLGKFSGRLIGALALRPVSSALNNTVLDSPDLARILKEQGYEYLIGEALTDQRFLKAISLMEKKDLLTFMKQEGVYPVRIVEKQEPLEKPLEEYINQQLENSWFQTLSPYMQQLCINQIRYLVETVDGKFHIPAVLIGEERLLIQEVLKRSQNSKLLDFAKFPNSYH